MKHELSQATQTIRETTLNFGFCSIHFGVYTERMDDLCKSRGVIMKFSGREPINTGETFNIFTLGLKAIRYGERMRIGFIKRKQTIQKL
jgi:hypothetical protein